MSCSGLEVYFKGIFIKKSLTSEVEISCIKIFVY